MSLHETGGSVDEREQKERESAATAAASGLTDDADAQRGDDDGLLGVERELHGGETALKIG